MHRERASTNAPARNEGGSSGDTRLHSTGEVADREQQAIDSIDEIPYEPYVEIQQIDVDGSLRTIEKGHLVRKESAECSPEGKSLRTRRSATVSCRTP